MLPRLAALALGTLLSAGALPALADVLIKVDKSSQRMSVLVDGSEVHEWSVSTGKAGFHTPDISRRPQRMERMHYSKEYDDAPMPFSIFVSDRGHAIHGTQHVKQLGTPASGGCIRLSYENAKTLYALVEKEGANRTMVVVKGETPVSVAGKDQRKAPRRSYRPDYDADDAYADDLRMRAPPGAVYEPYPYRGTYRPAPRGYRQDFDYGDDMY